MIACNKHPRSYVTRHCALQQRAALATIDARAGGDVAFVLLVDRDDVAHVAIGTIGEPLPDVMHTALWAMGIIQK